MCNRGVNGEKIIFYRKLSLLWATRIVDLSNEGQENVTPAESRKDRRGIARTQETGWKRPQPCVVAQIYVF